MPGIRMFAMALLAAVSPARAADPGQCAFIRDAGQRAYCRATTRGDVSQCGFIHAPDLRSLCRAETGKRPADCGFIRDPDLRALCRARTKP